MQQTILNVHFVPNLSDGTVSPSCPQYGGVQGDRNAACLSFLVPTTLRGSQFRYRIEGEDGAGGFVSTELLAIDDAGCVKTLLDERFTAAGGQILVRLVVSEMSSGNEVATVRSFDGRLFFADAPEGALSPAFRDTLSALLERTETHLAAIDDTVSTLSANQSMMQTTITGHGSRLTIAEESIGEMETQLEETDDTVSTLSANQSMMQTTITGHGSRLTAAESSIGDAETRLDGHDTRFDTDEETADELDEWVEDLSDKIQDLYDVTEKKDREPTPWSFIQKIVRAGLAEKLFSIGDRFETEHTDYGTIVWEIVDFDHDTPTDDRYSHSITLQTVDCLHKSNGRYDLKMLDAPSTTYINGFSDWEVSDLRTWLNSDEEAGHWFVPEHEGQTPPEYAAQAGFAGGFSESFLSVVGVVELPTSQNSTHTSPSTITYDTFFVPSRVELYAGNPAGNVIPAQGTVRTRYGEGYTTLTTPTSAADTNRIKTLNGTAATWWTRSATPANADIGMKVTAAGNVYVAAAREKYAVAPMCCIY